MDTSVRTVPHTRQKAEILHLVNRILSLVEAHKEPLPIGSYLHEPYVSRSMCSPRRDLNIRVAGDEARATFCKITNHEDRYFLVPVFVKPLSESVADLLRIHTAFPGINVSEMLQAACTELENRLEERRTYQRTVFTSELYKLARRLEEYAIYGMMTYPHLEVPQQFRNHEQLYWAGAYLASLLMQMVQARAACIERTYCEYPGIIQISAQPYPYPIVRLSLIRESFTYTYISRTFFLSHCEVSEQSDVSTLTAELAEVLRFDPYRLCRAIESAQRLQRSTRTWWTGGTQNDNQGSTLACAGITLRLPYRQR